MDEFEQIFFLFLSRMEAAWEDHAQKTKGARPDRAKSLVQVCKAALLLRTRRILNRAGSVRALSGSVLGPQPSPNSVFDPGRSGPVRTWTDAHALRGSFVPRPPICSPTLSPLCHHFLYTFRCGQATGTTGGGLSLESIPILT